MTIPTWPSELKQQVLVNGFSVGFRDGRLSSKMDRGPDKMRRLSSAAIKPLNCQIYATLDETARLERFWHEELVEGTLPFMFPSQLLHGIGLADPTGVTLLDPTGAEIIISAWDLVMFAADGAPLISAVSGLVLTQQFKLNVMP